jgi:hypothetical protein
MVVVATPGRVRDAPNHPRFVRAPQLHSADKRGCVRSIGTGRRTAHRRTTNGGKKRKKCIHAREKYCTRDIHIYVKEIRQGRVTSCHCQTT